MEARMKAESRRLVDLAVLMGISWAMRFYSCSHLKYVTDVDYFVGFTTIFMAIKMACFACCAKSQKVGGKSGKFNVVIDSTFTCVLFSVSILFGLHAFCTVLRMFSCERTAFANMSLTSTGILGTIQQCPWNDFDRTKWGLLMNCACPFDEGPLEMMLENRWPRRVGIVAEIFTLFLYPITMVVMCKNCMMMLEFLTAFYWPIYEHQKTSFVRPPSIYRRLI